MSQHNPGHGEPGQGEYPTERLDPTIYPTATYERAPQAAPTTAPNGAPGMAPEQQQLNPIYFAAQPGGNYGFPYGQGGQGGFDPGYPGHDGGGYGGQGGDGGWGGPPPYGYPGGPGGPGGFHQGRPRKKGHGAFWGLGVGALALSLVVGGFSGFAIGHSNGVNDGRDQAQSQLQNPNSGNGQQGSGNGGSDFGQLPGDGGSDSQGGDYENLPFNEFGNGQGNNAQRGQGITQGTKLSNGQPGFVVVNTTVSGGRGAGTGLVIESDGVVLTNYHVVEGSETVKVTDSTTNKTYDAQVLGRSQSKDVAVLKLKGASGLKTVDIADGSVKEGDSVSAIGNASGQGYLSKLDGKVTATKQSISTSSENGSSGEKLDDLIETDADVVPGYSGGAFVNSKGQVVGVTTAASSGNTSATVDGYAIPIGNAMDIAQKIQSGEGGTGIQLGRAAALGISVLAADSGEVGGGYGVTVNGLVDGGAAGELGIKQGDTIIGLDGQSVKSFDALKKILAKHEPGDKVSLTWLDSSGHKTTKDIKLGESSVN